MDLRTNSLVGAGKTLARRLVPEPAYAFARRLRHGPWSPPVGFVRFGSLRRLEPISRSYGYDRGRPIDRYYIENFLASERGHITGRVLEIGENTYTREFGAGVTRSDVLHVMEGIEGTTFVDDLAEGSTLPDQAFDCVIITQTLHLIYEMKAALRTIYRILKPGGVLLCTVPGITQISDEDWNDTWYWALTTNSARRLASEVFPLDTIEVKSFGNVLTATAFLQGLSDRELKPVELDHVDREYQVIVTLKAVRPAADFQVPMLDRWTYAEGEQFAYDEDTSYRKGMAFLDRRGTIEDWGCGTGYAKRFVTLGTYLGIDGSHSNFCDVKADLQNYRSSSDCIFMRHVLEHNWGWRTILANAVGSFRHRMVLILFTPFGQAENKIGDSDGIPDLSLPRQEVLDHFRGMTVREETIASKTQYGWEVIIYIEKAPLTHAEPATAKEA